MKRSFSGFVGSPWFLGFIGLFVFFAMLFGSNFTPSEISKELRWRERQTNLNTWFSMGLKPADTIPYKQGTERWDSIQRIFQNEDQLNHFKQNYSDFRGVTPFLLYQARECLRCYELPDVKTNFYYDDDVADYYFIGFKQYRLKDSRYYFRDNNTNFIIPFSRNAGPGNDSLLKRFRFYDKLPGMMMENMYSVPFRYDYWNDVVLIPVDKKTYSTLRTISSFFLIIVLVYSLILVLIIPGLVIANIGLGKAFHVRTIKMVDFLAYNFLLFPFVVFLYRCIVHFFVSKYITPDLEFTAWAELMRSGLIVYIGLILFALGVALKRGYKLQREQDLTI